MSTKPWRGWYHCIGNTYGTWLRGDGRGWRARHHREHVEGDYRNPPTKGTYDALHRYSISMMERDAVVFQPDVRPVVRDLLAGALQFYDVDLAALCVTAHHFHILANFRACRVKSPPAPAGGSAAPPRKRTTRSAFDIDPAPRLVLGKAKGWTTRQLKSKGWFTDHEGGLWAKRPHIVPIERQGHFEWVRDVYIPGHAKQGAAVWAPEGDG